MEIVVESGKNMMRWDSEDDWIWFLRNIHDIGQKFDEAILANMEQCTSERKQYWWTCGQTGTLEMGKGAEILTDFISWTKIFGIDDTDLNMSQATFRSFTLSSFLLTLHRIVKVPQVRLLKLWLLLLCGVLHLPFKYRRKSPVPSGNIMNSQRLYYVHTESKSSILTQEKSFVSTEYYNHVLWLNLTVLLYNYVMSNWSEYSKYVMHICSLLMSFLCNVIFNVTYKMSTYICVWTNSSIQYNLHYLPCVWSRLWGASLPLLSLLLLFLPASHGETAIMHYGHFGGLTISCKRTELILMESQHLGYSTDADCRPMGQCAVPYPLAKWYCRGRSKCGGMQVERRPLSKRTCGSDFTNCLRVEYQCIPSK